MKDLLCPKCGSTHLSANKAGFSLVTGVIGMNNIKMTCLECGNAISPGEACYSLEHVEDVKKLNKQRDYTLLGVSIFCLLFGLYSVGGAVLFFIFLFLFVSPLIYVIKNNKIKKKYK